MLSPFARSPDERAADDALLAALVSDEAPSWALEQLQAEIRRGPAAADVLAFLAAGAPIIDVRSPSEHVQGHIPGAVCVPLFSDDERCEVGKAYHQKGRAEAMALGMRLVRPGLARIVAAAGELTLAHGSGCTSPAVEGALPLAGATVFVHCWRGGLRSGAVAWLLRQQGFHVVTLAGGYKAFRAWVSSYWGDVEMPPRHMRTRPRGVPRPQKKKGQRHAGAAGGGEATDGEAGGGDAAGGEAAGVGADALSSVGSTRGGPAAAALNRAAAAAEAAAALAHVVAAARSLPGPRVCVIGGRTGVGKTRVLLALRSLGAEVIDLEGLARHRGSAFGWVGGDVQPSNEHFANVLALEWHAIAGRAARRGDSARGWVFIEDEDTHIGNVAVPKPVYAALRCATIVIRVELPENMRVALLVADYAHGHADGPHATEWLRRMEDSVAKLGKRLGGDRVAELVRHLRARDFEAVARAMLDYYDKLYDSHVANLGGTGSGAGARAGNIVPVRPAGGRAEFDAGELARLVLQRVEEAGVGAAGMGAAPKLEGSLDGSRVELAEAPDTSLASLSRGTHSAGGPRSGTGQPAAASAWARTAPVAAALVAVGAAAVAAMARRAR